MFLKEDEEFSCGFSAGVDRETERKHKTFWSQMVEKEKKKGTMLWQAQTEPCKISVSCLIIKKPFFFTLWFLLAHSFGQ